LEIGGKLGPLDVTVWGQAVFSKWVDRVEKRGEEKGYIRKNGEVGIDSVSMEEVQSKGRG